MCNPLVWAGVVAIALAIATSKSKYVDKGKDPLVKWLRIALFIIGGVSIIILIISLIMNNI